MTTNTLNITFFVSSHLFSGTFALHFAMGGLPSFENICRGELRLNTVSQKKLRLEVKKFWDVCEEANDWDLTSEETEEVASALIAEMAKEYLEDGWAKNGTFVPPGRSFWSSPESDDASPVYMYPRDAERYKFFEVNALQHTQR